MPNPKKPITHKQLLANQANAAHSTGPRTPEGKARSAQNSRKHFFTASSFGVARLEDLQEIAHLKADLVAVYQPVNSQELYALERVALQQQAIFRAARLEAGFFTACLNEAIDTRGGLLVTMEPEMVGGIEITRQQNRNFALAHGLKRMNRQDNSFALVLRYQAQAERLYRRAIEDFERLKALRSELPNEPILEPEPEANETTSDPSTSKPFVPPPDPVGQPAPEPGSGATANAASHLAPASNPPDPETPSPPGSAPAFTCTWHRTLCSADSLTARDLLPCGQKWLAAFTPFITDSANTLAASIACSSRTRQSKISTCPIRLIRSHYGHSFAKQYVAHHPRGRPPDPRSQARSPAASRGDAFAGAAA